MVSANAVLIVLRYKNDKCKKIYLIISFCNFQLKIFGTLRFFIHKLGKKDFKISTNTFYYILQLFIHYIIFIYLRWCEGFDVTCM